MIERRLAISTPLLGLLATSALLIAPAGSARTAAGDGSVTLRGVEERYQELMADPEVSAPELYRIGSWCQTVADELSPEGRRRFRERSRRCFRRAEAKARNRINRIFAEARSGIEGAAEYDEARQVRDRATREAEEFIEELLPLCKPHTSAEPFREAYNEGVAILEEAITPVRDRDTLEKIRSDLVFLQNVWLPIDSRDPKTHYEGVAALSHLVRDPERLLNRRVTIEFISSGERFRLLDLVLLDGFDQSGTYVPPNFMTDRLVLVLKSDDPSWTATLDGLRARGGHGKQAAAFRFRALVRVAARERQHTPFYAAEIEQLVVFDENGELLGYLGPHPGGSK